MRGSRAGLAALAPTILALIVSIFQVEGAAFVNIPDTSKPLSSVALTVLPDHFSSIHILRGGADDSSDDDSSDEEDEAADESESEDEEEQKSELDAKLVASTLKTNAKNKAKAAKEVKEAINAKLAQQPRKKSKRKLFRLPYIIRACLNPVTLVRMTLAYWQSLIDLDYGKEDASQELRSALETKAKAAGGGGGNRRPGAKKRGQMNTLSDLPPLNT